MLSLLFEVNPFGITIGLVMSVPYAYAANCDRTSGSSLMNWACESMSEMDPVVAMFQATNVTLSVDQM